MEEPEFTKDPGITEPLDDHLGTFYLCSDWLPLSNRFLIGWDGDRIRIVWWNGTVVQCVDEEQLANTKSDMQRKGNWPIRDQEFLTNDFRGILTIISIKNGEFRSTRDILRHVFMEWWRHKWWRHKLWLIICDCVITKNTLENES